MFRYFRPAAALAFLLSIVAFAVPAHSGELNKGLPKVTIKIGSGLLTAEVASTVEQQQIGLMNRKIMAENEGMIFVYTPPRPVAFWMKNTLIPLSAAFVAADGTVVKIADMAPLDDKTHHAADVPVKYVIETNRGWFKKAGVGVGDTLKIELK
jgi:uncharacterized protein